MRCPQCEKFVSLDMGDPEIEESNVDPDGGVTITVRIVRTCADCGEELKEARLELETSIPAENLNGHVNPEKPEPGAVFHDLQIEVDEVNPIEESGGRFKKSYFGAEVTYRVTCACEGDRWGYDGCLSDKVAASSMDELV